MKTLKNSLVIAMLAICFIACKNETAPEVVTIDNATKDVSVSTHDLDPNATYAKAEFTIEGMTCAMGCAKSIEKKMANMEGVKSATVDFDRQLAMVEYDEAKVNATSLEAVVKKAGDMYAVKDMKTVDTFSMVKTCNMACCEGKTAEEKANCNMACCSSQAETSTDSTTKMACAKDCKMACCANKTEAEKTACAKDCKMACCADKAKA